MRFFQAIIIFHTIYLDYNEVYIYIFTGNAMNQIYNQDSLSINKENPRGSPEKLKKNQILEDVSSYILSHREPNMQVVVNDDELIKVAPLTPSAVRVPNETQCPESFPLIKSSEEDPKIEEKSPLKKNKTARNLTSKDYSSSSDEQDEKHLKVARKRKMTMEIKNKNQEVMQRLPEYSPERRKPAMMQTGPITKPLGESKFPEEDYSGNILEPSEKMLLKQKEINETYLDLQKCKSRTQFLLDAVPVGTRMVFEVMIDQDTMFGREYSFWLGGDQGKIVLMQAKKHLKLLESYFVIRQYLEDYNAMNFLAKMSSDLTRIQYTLTNEQEGIENQGKYIFADLSVYSVDKSKPALGIYFPAFDYYTNQQKPVKMCGDPEILKTMSKGGAHINCLSPCQMDPFFEKRFMQDKKLIATNRSISLIDRQGLLKVYVSKVQSKKYRIYAGSGVSPLILFAMFIVLYESS